MKFWRIGIAGCLTAALCSGCVSIGNQGWNDLSESDKAEVKGALQDAKEEVESVWQEVRAELAAELAGIDWTEISAELEAAKAEAGSAWREAQAELAAELDEINWAEVLLEKDDEERSRRLLWEKADGITNEISDWEAFTGQLAIDEWEPYEGMLESEEEIVYTVQQKKSIGLLDSHQEEYITLGTVTIYKDSDIVCAEGAFLEELMEPFGLKEDQGLQFKALYQVPEEDLKLLRQQ